LVNVKGTVLESAEFETKSNKLPVKQIEQRFNVRNLIWADVDAPIAAGPDGFSTMAFSAINQLDVRGDKQN